MKTKKIKLGIRILLILSITYIGVCVLTEAVYYFLVPERYYASYPAIGGFYLVMGVISYYSMVHYRNTSHDHLLHVYMFGRMVKFFLTMFFLLFYIFIIAPDNRKAFAMITIVYFFVFSGLEMYIYSLFNNRITKHEKKHKKYK
jgi:hypothetical protein